MPEQPAQTASLPFVIAPRHSFLVGAAASNSTFAEQPQPVRFGNHAWRQIGRQCCWRRSSRTMLHGRAERLSSIAAPHWIGAVGVGLIPVLRRRGNRHPTRWRSELIAPVQPPSKESGSTTGGSQLPYLYGTAWKKEATADLVVQAVRAGFRGIDTACQPKHYREDLVGAAIARLAKEDELPREALWLQTKFTPLRGQDPERVPYDPDAAVADQAKQSLARSLENLGTAYIDSLCLHGPLPDFDETMEVWRVFEAAVDVGIARQLGICNCYDVKLFQALYTAARVKPKVLQNRFYAQTGYDAELRAFCLEHGVTYQTFWTLTANPDILRSEPVQQAARRLSATPEQILFRWLQLSGHQPLTGTTSAVHMRQDLDAVKLALNVEEVEDIGTLFRAKEESGGCVIS